MGGLTAVSTVLGAAPCLHAQKTAQLNLIRIEVAPMKSMGFEQKLVEWRVVKLLRFRQRPIMPLVKIAGQGKPSLLLILISLTFVDRLLASRNHENPRSLGRRSSRCDFERARGLCGLLLRSLSGVPRDAIRRKMDNSCCSRPRCAFDRERSAVQFGQLHRQRQP